MPNVTNTREIVFALQQHGQDMEREISDELAGLAQQAARTMQRLVPKSRSSLWKSIDVRQREELVYEIRPTLNYAQYVEDGVKRGGKGLPRFFDPASASIVDWLKSHPQGGGFAKRTASMGSKVFQAANLALRDRYEGLALHVRKHGVKAHPFVEPTAREMEPIVLSRLNLAVRRVLAARPDTGGVA
jgi:hypothetical protein